MERALRISYSGLQQTSSLGGASVNLNSTNASYPSLGFS